MRCSLLTLSGYVDGELDARRRGEVEAHLVACARSRSGLGHLKEEIERIGSLAPVIVPDSSARLLMEALELLGPDDALPERTSPPSRAPAAAAPPWLQGHAGPALPWTAPPRQPRALSVAHEEATIHLHGSTTPLRRDDFGGVPAIPFDMEQLRASPPFMVSPDEDDPPANRPTGER